MQQGRQARGGRIGVLLAAQAAAGVAFAGQQQFGKALRPAQRVAAFEQAQQRRGTQLAAAMHIAVFARDHVGQFVALHADAQALAHLAHQLGTAHLVGDVARPLGRRRGALAQVVPQAGPAHGQRGVQCRGTVQHHHQVHASVDLGVVLRPLRHAPQAVHLGQQALQCAASTQHVEHAAGARRHQAAREFLPHPFRHQGIDLASLHHLHQQRLGFWGHREVRKPRRQPGQAQHAHGVFNEGRRNMAEHARLQVALAAMRVDERAVFGLGDGVDGEVSARQVFLQRDAGCRMHREAAVAAAALAFGARQGHFFARGGVDEDRKILAHRAVAQRHQLVGRGTHGDPVAVAGGQAQQRVAHRAANDKNLHARAAAGQRLSAGCGRARLRARSRARPGPAPSTRPRRARPPCARCSAAYWPAPAGRSCAAACTPARTWRPRR